MSDQLDSLKQRYFELSRQFLFALQQNKDATELDALREEIRTVVATIEVLETDASTQTE